MEKLQDYHARLRYINGTVNNLVDYLYLMDKITQQHHQCAQTYELWQMISRQKSSYAMNCLYSGELRSGNPMDTLDPSNFHELIRKLAHLCDHVEHALYAPASEKNRFEAFRHAPIYIKAFEKMEEIMMDMKERAEMAQKELEPDDRFR